MVQPWRSRSRSMRTVRNRFIGGPPLWGLLAAVEVADEFGVEGEDDIRVGEFVEFIGEIPASLDITCPFGFYCGLKGFSGDVKILYKAHEAHGVSLCVPLGDPCPSCPLVEG